MAFGRAFVAGFGLAFVGAVSLSRFHFTRALAMSAFHDLHLKQRWRKLQVSCHEQVPQDEETSAMQFTALCRMYNGAVLKLFQVRQSD
jgi:hypothetical protein